MSTPVKTDNQRVGATLRTLRTRYGYKSPAELAHALNKSRQYIYLIETGVRPLPDHLLYHICELLECEPLAIKRPDQEPIPELAGVAA